MGRPILPLTGRAQGRFRGETRSPARASGGRSGVTHGTSTTGPAHAIRPSPRRPRRLAGRRTGCGLRGPRPPLAGSGSRRRRRRPGGAGGHAPAGADGRDRARCRRPAVAGCAHHVARRRRRSPASGRRRNRRARTGPRPVAARQEPGPAPRARDAPGPRSGGLHRHRRAPRRAPVRRADPAGFRHLRGLAAGGPPRLRGDAGKRVRAAVPPRHHAVPVRRCDLREPVHVRRVPARRVGAGRRRPQSRGAARRGLPVRSRSRRRARARGTVALLPASHHGQHHPARPDPGRPHLVGAGGGAAGVESSDRLAERGAARPGGLVDVRGGRGRGGVRRGGHHA